MALKIICLVFACLQLTLPIVTIALGIIYPCLPLPQSIVPAWLEHTISIIWLMISCMLIYGVHKLDNDFIYPYIAFVSISVVVYLAILTFNIIKLCDGLKDIVRCIHVSFQAFSIVLHIITLLLLVLLTRCNENEGCDFI